MRVILPELEAMKGCLQRNQFHPEGDVFTHTRLMLELLQKEFPDRWCYRLCFMTSENR